MLPCIRRDRALMIEIGKEWMDGEVKVEVLAGIRGDK
jgi:hypothetical protein